MAFSYSKTIVIGNLGRDPELRYTTDGKAVTSMSVAVSRSYKKGDDRVEVTDWFNVVVWGQGAEYIAENARKGDRVFVEGEMREEKWKDKDGNEKRSWKLNAFNTMLLSPKHEGAAPAAAGDASAPAPATGKQDDLPF